MNMSVSGVSSDSSGRHHPANRSNVRPRRSRARAPVARQSAPEHLVSRADRDDGVDPPRAKQSRQAAENPQIVFSAEQIAENTGTSAASTSPSSPLILEAANLRAKLLAIHPSHKIDQQRFRSPDLERCVDKHHPQRPARWGNELPVSNRRLTREPLVCPTRSAFLGDRVPCPRLCVGMGATCAWPLRAVAMATCRHAATIALGGLSLYRIAASSSPSGRRFSSRFSTVREADDRHGDRRQGHERNPRPRAERDRQQGDDPNASIQSAGRATQLKR